MNQFKKAYELNKKWFFSLPENKGYQLHHLFPGKSGILLCCRLGFIGLNHEEHSEGHSNGLLVNMLRKENYELRRQICANYNRMTMNCDKKISDKCNGCPLTN